MPANPLPNRFNDLSTTSLRMAEALETHGDEIEIDRDADMIRKALAKARTRDEDFQSHLADRTTVLTPALKAVDQEGREFIGKSIKVLRVHLGERWNQSWSEAGFLDGKSAIPSRLDRREALLQSLATYFTSHPQFENKDFTVTAARAQELFDAMGKAQRAIQDSESKQVELRVARDKAVNTLRKRMRGVITDLNAVLNVDSPLWKAFGVNPPTVRPKTVKPKAAKKPRKRSRAAAPDATAKTDASAVSLAG